MLCSRLRRSTSITHSQGGGERTAIASRVSTCRQNGLVHERLRYPKPSFLVLLDFRSWKSTSGDLSVIIDVEDQLLRSLSLLAMLHVDAGELRRVHAAQGLSSHRRQEQEGWCSCHTVDYLVVCIDGRTCHEPMRGLLREERREVFPTNICLVKSRRFRARIHDERGQWRENVNKSSLKEKSLPRETAPRPTTHVHLRSVGCHRGWFLTAPFCF